MLIVFDLNVRTDESVAVARLRLSAELARRGAEVLWVELPEVTGVNGVDDLLAVKGPDAALPLFSKATPFNPSFRTTDYGNAERLVTRHGTNIRFCHAWQKWLCWDGRRWVADESGEIVRLAEQTVREIGREACDTEDEERRKKVLSWVYQSEKAARIAAMIKLAESEPDVPVAPEELDSNPWLLNCQNGTLDLRAGQLRPHRREDFITKLVHFDYNPKAQCNLFLAFLHRIMGDSPDACNYEGRGRSGSSSTSKRFLAMPSLET